MNATVEKVREKAVVLSSESDVPDDVLALIGEARFVLIGEASHGTHEFYKCRAEITKRLIEEKGFSAVAVEADFPDAYHVNRYARNFETDKRADEALSAFKRFPLWMWRNVEVLDFIGWLKTHNDKLPISDKIGFYGIDLYSLHASMEAVLNFLSKVDPEAAKIARRRYECFDHFGEDAQSYGYAASYDQRFSCEDEAVNQLIELQRRAVEYVDGNEFAARDEYFFAEQNARLVKNSEEYYREMFRGRVSSWNLRDSHMAETLEALAAHLKSENLPAKIVVWAHNSHLGDARATEMGERGEWNVGQLIREKYGERETCLLGFTTHTGTVAAADNWDEPAQVKQIRPSRKDSCEQIFHQTGLPRFFLNLRDAEMKDLLNRPQLTRAIGVIYRPQTERASHYFAARLSGQFDGIIHFNETRAVTPLDDTSGWAKDDAPETFPEGL